MIEFVTLAERGLAVSDTQLRRQARLPSNLAGVREIAPILRGAGGDRKESNAGHRQAQLLDFAPIESDLN